MSSAWIWYERLPCGGCRRRWPRTPTGVASLAALDAAIGGWNRTLGSNRWRPLFVGFAQPRRPRCSSLAWRADETFWMVPVGTLAPAQVDAPVQRQAQLAGALDTAVDQAVTVSTPKIVASGLRPACRSGRVRQPATRAKSRWGHSDLEARMACTLRCHAGRVSDWSRGVSLDYSCGRAGHSPI